MASRGPAVKRHENECVCASSGHLMCDIAQCVSGETTSRSEYPSCLPSSCKIVSYCNHDFDGEDIGELERKGIWYCNGAGAATESRSNIGLFLILAVFCYTTFCELTVRKNGKADLFHVEDMCSESHEPSGKVLGIVGIGDIGAAVARPATVIYHGIVNSVLDFNPHQQDSRVIEGLHSIGD
ncbi:hypothetical protein EDB80DRAFT_691573 [Ilyonectria destructans]|nr:hypothetical protein EDB80DRAFT_691573 [Ilyonectria destructans]